MSKPAIGRRVLARTVVEEVAEFLWGLCGATSTSTLSPKTGGQTPAFVHGRSLQTLVLLHLVEVQVAFTCVAQVLVRLLLVSFCESLIVGNVLTHCLAVCRDLALQDAGKLLLGQLDSILCHDILPHLNELEDLVVTHPLKVSVVLQPVKGFHVRVEPEQIVDQPAQLPTLKYLESFCMA